LLRSMTVMQQNIREMVEREQAQRRSAQNRLAEALENSREAVVLVDAEDRIVIANSQLANFFPQLAPQLQSGMRFTEAFRQAAEAASEAKGTFLANMSHELRTPLNAIIGFSEVMAGEVLGELNPSYVQYAKDIRQSGRHLLDIISSVLDLSKSEAGKLELSDQL